MKCFFNNELKIDDEVIYIKGVRSGSSTVRNVLFKGKIIGFTPKSVRILRQYTNENFCVGGEDLIQSTHVCKLNICEDGTSIKIEKNEDEYKIFDIEINETEAIQILENALQKNDIRGPQLYILQKAIIYILSDYKKIKNRR